jgi:RHS repeat-associated protein
LDIGAYSSYADATGEHGYDSLVSYPHLRSYRNPAGVTNLGHTPLCEFGHQGLMHDEMLGLIYNRARMLRFGRFMQRDPWMRDSSQPTAGDGYQDGMNAYSYCGANPLTHQDWSGETRTDFFRKYVLGQPVKKAYGVNFDLIGQLKLPGVPGFEMGAGKVLVFFTDTCEIARFTVTAGYFDNKNFDGKFLEFGAQAGLNAHVEAATMGGPPPAGAKQFEGYFATLSVAGEIPLPIVELAAGVGASLYVSVPLPSRRYWVGGTVGWSPKTPGIPVPVTGGVVAWRYRLDGKPIDLDDYGLLGKCACGQLVSAVPSLPNLP